MAEAKAIWENALDGDKITERERESMRYILKNFPFDAAGKAYLSKLVDPPASGESYLVTVNGNQVQRALWDEACKLTQDGNLDLDEAKDLWKIATKDGVKISACEAVTLRTVLAMKKCSPRAREYLASLLPAEVENAVLRIPAPATNANASSDVVWQCVKKHNAFLTKRTRVSFCKEKGNLMNVNTFKHSGLANAMKMDIESHGEEESTDTHIQVTSSAEAPVVLKGSDVKGMARRVQAVARQHRPDLQAVCMARVTYLHKALRSKRNTIRKAKK